MEKKKMASSARGLADAVRYMILAIIAFTALNIILALAGSEDYYVATVFSAYYAFAESRKVATGIILAVLILAPFIVSFILWKKKPFVWALVSLILFVLDALVIVWFIHEYKPFPFVVIDLVVHAICVIVLIMGVVSAKKTQSEDALQPVRSAQTYPQQAAPAQTYPLQHTAVEKEGSYQDVACTVAISNEGNNFSLMTEGIIRFYQNEAAVGTKSVAMGVMFGMIGNALSAPKEKIRFPYTSIARLYYYRKRGYCVRIDLSSGSSVCLVLNKSNVERFTALFATHGLRIAPFVESL